MKSDQIPSSTSKQNETTLSPNSPEPVCQFRAGARCPRCKEGILDYNGMLILECPVCGLQNGYGFT